jgi:hypothetical protein
MSKQIWFIAEVGEREESMTLSAHKFLFSLIVLAALLGFGWVLIIYVLSFHAAQWVIDRVDGGYEPRRPAVRPIPRRARYSRA